jgi:hypothetical protein
MPRNKGKIRQWGSEEAGSTTDMASKAGGTEVKQAGVSLAPVFEKKEPVV